MIANFFGKSNPANFFTIISLFLVFYIVVVISNFSIDSMDLEFFIHQLSIIGLFTLLFLFFNWILLKNKLTLYNSYGFLFFVLLFGIFPTTIISRQELITNLFLLVFLRRVYSLRTPKVLFKKMFDSGFWLSILFMLHPFMLIYGILLYASILFFHKLNFRTFFIPIVGFIVPLFCFFTYCFWFDEITRFINLFNWGIGYDMQFYLSAKILIPVIFIGIIILISIFSKTMKLLLVSGLYRKLWFLTLLNLIVATGVIFLTKNKTGGEFIYAFFPLAIVLANWVERIKKSTYRDLILGAFMITLIILLII